MRTFKPRCTVFGITLRKQGFKVKSKVDAMDFINRCIMANTEVVITVQPDMEYRFLKDSKGVFSVSERRGDLRDPFNPTVEIANSQNTSYKMSVVDAVWNLRKYINNTMLADTEE